MPAAGDPVPRALGTGPVRGPVLGTVTEFDIDRGLGTVTDDEERPWPFHSTAIVDGSRSIALGTRVAVVLVPGTLGRLEARGVSPLAPDRSASGVG